MDKNNKEVTAFMAENETLLKNVPKEVLEDVVDCKIIIARNMKHFCEDCTANDITIEKGEKEAKQLKTYFERLGGMSYIDVGAIKPNLDIVDSLYCEKGGEYYSYPAMMDSPSEEDVTDIDLYNSCYASVTLADYFDMVSDDFKDIVTNLQKTYKAEFPKGLTEYTENNILPKDVLLLKECLKGNTLSKKSAFLSNTASKNKGNEIGGR